MDCYVGADFMGLRGYINPQYPNCAKSGTVFVVNFTNFPILWVSSINTEIDISTLHYEYVVLPHSVRDFFPWKALQRN